MADTGRLRTLSIDVGGITIKGAVLDESGSMVSQRLSAETRYPAWPTTIVSLVAALVGEVSFDRVSVGFPGMVRSGRVLTAPSFWSDSGPGGEVSNELVAAWSGFALADVLSEKLAAPTRVVNDADMQGLAVIERRGLEVVMTLGTGFGTAMFLDGQLLPHFEFAGHPFREGQPYGWQLADVTRREVGDEAWNARVKEAIHNLRALTFFDRLYIGGGNAQRLTIKLRDDVRIVDNVAGILGGFRVWNAAAP
ncbi:MAG: ROK family protein [Acidimicrobiales bacterium]